MQQRDYILNYLEKLGMVLGVLLGLKKEGKIKEANDVIDEAFKGMLDLDIIFIYQTAEEKIVDQLVNEKEFNIEQLNMLAELLYEKIIIHDLKNEKEMIRSLSGKLLKLYDYLNGKEKTFSFDRMDKIEKIKRGIIVRDETGSKSNPSQA